MSTRPLLVFDFDGVIIDGIHEYWWSARKTCLELLTTQSDTTSLTESIPDAFRQLRPWVHKGWEMVLIAAELIRSESPLVTLGAKIFSQNYHLHCKEALQAWKWTPDQLQNALENIRRQAISNNRQSWLSKHRAAFPEVPNRLNELKAEGYEFAVLTTKGIEFTNALLNYLNLNPNLVYGHEAGSKTNILMKLSKTHVLRGFIEDRRTTLETVLKATELRYLPCYLASWGYLKEEDQTNLGPNIHLLNKKTFMTPLASWP